MISLVRMEAHKSVVSGEVREQNRSGSVSKVEMMTPMALIYMMLFPSISTFETPPPCSHAQDGLLNAREDFPTAQGELQGVTLP